MMSSDTKALAVTDQKDPEWQEIVNQIVDDLNKEDLPEQVIQATELLLAGWPTYKAAQRLGVKTAAIRKWLQAYPAMALAVANGRKMLSKWRMSKLEQQFLQAIEKSEEILDLDLGDDTVNAKLVATVAQHARYIISLFAGQKIDINVTVEEGTQTLKARNDALAYLAEELAKQRDSGETIEATYRIVDATPEEGKQKPLLDQDGNPPFGKIGELDTTGEGTICHICGIREVLFEKHINQVHHMKTKEYELMYMLDLGAVKKADEKRIHDADTC